MTDENQVPRDEYYTAQQTWLKELKASHDELEEFHNRGDKILDFYIDDRKVRRTKRYPLFNTNVSILENALFARIPQPAVGRRFKNPEDHVGRVASLILQRALVTELDSNFAFKTSARSAIKDMLVVGLGVGWVRYEAEELEPQLSDDENSELAERDDASPILKDQQTPIDYVHWKDFRFSPCRTWNENRWVARRVFVDEPEAEARFGERAQYLTFNTNSSGQGTVYSDNNTSDAHDPQNAIEPQAAVWEIWDKTTKKVYWISENCETALDIKDDFLGLPDFFPTERPLIANIGTSNFVPIADYTQIQDQYNDLNETNNRISRLVKACRLAGVYDKAQAGVKQLLESGEEHKLIPVDNWDKFASKDGLKGAIEFLPLEMIVATLAQLRLHLESVKQQIYELTGISDIVRGSTSPYETQGAQQMKAQYASVRLQGKQTEVAEYLTSMIRRKAFLMLKFYSPERLMERAGMLPESDQQYIGPALELLKNDLLTSLKIDISTDSLQQPNWARDQAERTQVVTALGQLLGPVMQQPGVMEALAPLYAHVIKWSISGAQGAAEIEGVLDMGLQQLTQQGQQQKGPSPEEQAQQAAQQAAEAKMAQAQAEFQFEQEKAKAHLQLEREKFAAEMQFEREKFAAEIESRERVETMKAKQKNVPQYVHGNNGADEERIVELVAGVQQSTLAAVSAMQQSTVDAIAAIANQPQEPATVVVQRQPDGSLVGSIQ